MQVHYSLHSIIWMHPYIITNNFWIKTKISELQNLYVALINLRIFHSFAQQLVIVYRRRRRRGESEKNRANLKLFGKIWKYSGKPEFEELFWDYTNPSRKKRKILVKTFSGEHTTQHIWEYFVLNFRAVSSCPSPPKLFCSTTAMTV